MQTQPITRKPLLTTLCLALVSLFAACDNAQAEEAAKMADTAENRASAVDVSAGKVPAGRQVSPEADVKTQHECPTGISPAQTREQLAENILFFVKNARDKGREFYSRHNIACYFQGDINWLVFTKDDNNEDNKKEEILTELPDVWGVDGVDSLNILHILPSEDYEFRVLYDYQDKGCTTILSGKDKDFNPIPVLDKYFTDTERQGYHDPVKEGSMTGEIAPYISVRREEPVEDYAGINYEYSQILERNWGPEIANKAYTFQLWIGYYPKRANE